MKKTALILILFNMTASCWSISHHPQAFLKSIANRKDEGQQIVRHYCATCHATQPLINLGAPRIHSNADWQPRIKQGLEQLFQHTAQGLNAMPARGGCFECSDEQLKRAIAAMLPHLKPAKSP